MFQTEPSSEFKNQSVSSDGVVVEDFGRGAEQHIVEIKRQDNYTCVIFRREWLKMSMAC
jgi:hypothetical protein